MKNLCLGVFYEVREFMNSSMDLFVKMRREIAAMCFRGFLQINILKRTAWILSLGFFL